jgi:HEAT repeat protein
MTHTYTEPVSKLLELGMPEDPWLDYASLGITHDDIPELLRLLRDGDLRWMERPDDLPDDEDLTEWYAQIHAWRALAQLKAEEAILPIIGLLHQIDDEDDDWLSSDVDQIFALLGPASIQPLGAYLLDEENQMYARAEAASALGSIGKARPETRDACVKYLVSALEKYEENDEGLNGFLIYDLVQLKAVEHVDLIGDAFAAEAVDEFIMGDFEDVQVELGLLKERTTARRPLLPNFLPDTDGFPRTSKPKKLEKKTKSKRKQEKKSRKKNRKRK